MSDEINIKELPTDELLELMGEDLYDGYADEIVEEVEEALGRGMTPYEVLTQGLVAGMDVVGADFRDGILFVPEVLMAAKAHRNIVFGNGHHVGSNACTGALPSARNMIVRTDRLA